MSKFCLPAEDSDENKLGGVCSAIAEYFGVDVTIVRILFLIGLFVPSVPAGFTYLVLWVCAPRKPNP